MLESGRNNAIQSFRRIAAEQHPVPGSLKETFRLPLLANVVLKPWTADVLLSQVPARSLLRRSLARASSSESCCRPASSGVRLFDVLDAFGVEQRRYHVAWTQLADHVGSLAVGIAAGRCVHGLARA